MRAATELSLRTRRPRAFTIIELLVVIAIIAILAGLLLPVVHRARGLARVTTTKNNMKTVQVACQVYITTYSETDNALPLEKNDAIAEADWGGFRADALPTLIVKGYIDGRRRGFSSAELTKSIADIPGYDDDFTIGVGSPGSLIAGDTKLLKIITDPDYDPLNPRYPGITAGSKNWRGPFGPCRNAIWVYYEPEELDEDGDPNRIVSDVTIAIGCRGPDRTWQTHPTAVTPSGTGFVCSTSGEDGDLFILMKQDGTWIPFPEGVIKD